jgi:23S rRNA pseudouridine1911/1915/1917 synthase
MLQADRVRVNGDPERNAKRRITPQDRIDIGSKKEIPDPRIAILHEDADLIVIDKAAGLLTVASPTEAEETAVAFLNTYLGARRGEDRVHVVHRLDYDCSGVLVFAKDADMRRRLQARFAAHDIDRIYVAIIHGQLPQPVGTIRSWLAEDRLLRVSSTANEQEGKEAITHYRTVASGPRYAVLEVTLETGRRNQIRVHLAEAGHPIVGDTMYGKGRENPVGRLALHARELGFVHPRTGKKLRFSVPVPEAFRNVKL